VIAPLVAGALLPRIGYEGVFLWTGILIALSVPFAAMMRIAPQPAPSAVPAVAE